MHSSHLSWPVLCLFLGASLDCVLAAQALNRRNFLPAAPYAIASLISAFWSLTYGLELSSNDFQTKLRLLQVRMLVLPYWVLPCFETTYRYIRGRRCLTGWLLVLLLVVPTISAALAWLPGPGFNPLYSTNFRIERSDGLSILRSDISPWGTVANTFAYTVGIVGWIIAVRALLSAGWERKPLLIILFAWHISVAADVLWRLRITRPVGLNYEPILLPVTNGIIAFALFRGRLLDLAPVVRATLVENLEDLLVVFDLERRIIDLNRAASLALQMTPAVARGLTAAEALRTWPQVVATLDQAFDGKHEVAMNGRFYELLLLPAVDNWGRRCATLLILRDITTRKLAEERAAQSMAIARAASEAKGHFLAMMSHEIRTPMSGMIGFAEMLSATALTEQQREFLSYLTECGNSLKVIIDDVLDFSKIEAGELQLEKIAIDLRALLASSCSALLPRARAQGLHLRWQVDESAPKTVFGDPVRLRQIVTNLTGNAIKFTAQGGVDVSLRCSSAADEEGGATLVIEVRDSGIGIAPDALKKLFQPFTQADSSTTRLYGGTGLGLAITRQLCELMAGDLKVSSEPNRGSIFTASVRVALNSTAPPAARTSGQTTAEATVAPRSVLLIEDNPIIERMLTGMLRQAGHRVQAVSGGVAALALIDEGKRFDVILLDLQMPVMDGYMTVAEIRRRETRGGPAHHIIAVTAHALKGERQKCLDAGMNDYLTKPVDRARLAEALARAGQAASAAR